ncbi:DUF4931 domain-containing protein [Bacillus sp. Brlt_9]|uniref:DUF4931 domain-containing protein n=1 Tax=Bacillus sp. Brlt_9 TaxID=3110916 RepID=UPI003F7CB915
MTYITYRAGTGKSKPNTVFNKESQCPFCNRDSLRLENGIISETEDFMIIKNKFPVLENTYPTVLIEHKNCGEHIGTYSIPYLTKLLTFALDHYHNLAKDPKFTSVLFFKNHGAFSGASINHSHMQVIGIEDKDYRSNLNKSDLEGLTIYADDTFTWNISTQPRNEFFEFNLILKDLNRLDILAIHLQETVNYILNTLNTKFESFNLAFYITENEIAIKVLSRGPTSVLLLGFGIKQLPNNLEQIVHDLNKDI